VSYRRIRWIYQVGFFGLFVFLLVAGAMGLVERYATELFLDMSVLAGLATVITQHNLMAGMFLGVLIAAATLFVGRFFCGWVCPMGACQQLGAYVFEGKDRKDRYTRNSFSRWQRVKYAVLAVFVLAAVFGVVLAGLLDPIALITRFGVTVVRPFVDLVGQDGATQTVAFDAAVATGVIFVAAFLMNLVQPRFWCRTICPLGAMLGLFSLRPVFRMVRDEQQCIRCGRCTEECQGACEPDKALVPSECVMCMNCIDVCPTRAIAFKATRRLEDEAAAQTWRGAWVSRRQFIAAAVGGLASVAVLRNWRNILGRGYPKRIRPPGSLDEEDFLARCIRCGACMNVCPTNVIQPSGGETDAEGLWTPVLKMRYGYCEYECVKCSQVCPTGAIQKIGIEQKHEESFAHIGTAFVDRGRCLPWSFGKECLVCQEVCPVSPKAIYFQAATYLDAEGQSVEMKVPYIRAEQCIGCGACEYHCPVQDKAAIRITSIGEHRSQDRKLLL